MVEPLRHRLHSLNPCPKLGLGFSRLKLSLSRRGGADGRHKNISNSRHRVGKGVSGKVAPTTFPIKMNNW